MKLITLCLLLALAVPLSANPFNPINWVTGGWNRFWAWGEPECAPNGVIAPRDDTRHRGPVCDEWEWNKPGILEADYTQAQLANIKDPEEFGRKRIAHAFPPTAAVFVNFIALPRETPVEPRLLASQAQLDRVRIHLRDAAVSLNLPCSMALYEHTRGLYGGTIDYRGDARRIWYAETEAYPATGGIMISRVVAMFAANPSEAARKYLAADVRSICTALANRPARRPLSE